MRLICVIKLFNAILLAISFNVSGYALSAIWPDLNSRLTIIIIARMKRYV